MKSGEVDREEVDMSGINNDALHAVNRRSRLLTEGVVRSPNRAMLRAVGFADGDFAKPIAWSKESMGDFRFR